MWMNAAADAAVTLGGTATAESPIPFTEDRMMPYGLHYNYLAILVATVATFALGMVWYNPVFLGKKWIEAHEYTPEQLQAFSKGLGKMYGWSFVAYVVMALGLSTILQLTSIIRWQGGMKLGALCWLAFAATIGLTSNLFSQKKFATYVIDAGYQLVYLMVMGAILAGWR